MLFMLSRLDRDLIIALDVKTFRYLSAKAAEEGINLKALIESSLEKLAENIQDSELYSYLVKTLPEGKENIKGQEKEEFEKWLGL